MRLPGLEGDHGRLRQRLGSRSYGEGEGAEKVCNGGKSVREICYGSEISASLNISLEEFYRLLKKLVVRL